MSGLAGVLLLLAFLAMLMFGVRFTQAWWALRNHLGDGWDLLEEENFPGDPRILKQGRHP